MRASETTKWWKSFNPKAHFIHFFIRKSHYSCTSWSYVRPVHPALTTSFPLSLIWRAWATSYIGELAVTDRRQQGYSGPSSWETGCSAAPSTSTLTHITPSPQDSLEIYHRCMEASLVLKHKRKNMSSVEQKRKIKGSTSPCDEKVRENDANAFFKPLYKMVQSI